MIKRAAAAIQTHHRDDLTRDDLIGHGAVLELLAKEVEERAMSKASEILMAAYLEHRDDLNGFSFSCKQLYSGFLSFQIAREANPTEPKKLPFYTLPPLPQHYSTSLNLNKIRGIQLIDGSKPDYNGELTYSFWMPEDDNDGCGILGGTMFGVFPPRPGHHYEVNPNYPTRPHGRSLFFLDPLNIEEKETNFIDSGSYVIQFRTRPFPRFAVDDTIRFDGLGASIFVPAGKGAEVYATIMAESRAGLAPGI